MFGKIQANLERFLLKKLLHLSPESIFRGELLKPLVSGRVFFSVNLNITRSTSWGNLPLGLLAAFLLFLYFVSQTFIDEVFLRPERKDEPRKIGAFLALLLLLDWAIHFWTMLSNRFDSSFLLARRNHLHQENVGFWQTLMCLGLAFLLSTFNIFPHLPSLGSFKGLPNPHGYLVSTFHGLSIFPATFFGHHLIVGFGNSRAEQQIERCGCIEWSSTHTHFRARSSRCEEQMGSISTSAIGIGLASTSCLYLHSPLAFETCELLLGDWKYAIVFCFFGGLVGGGGVLQKTFQYRLCTENA